jgi:hypothetical protein
VAKQTHLVDVWLCFVNVRFANLFRVFDNGSLKWPTPNELISGANEEAPS